jgi:hypothetical protein
MPNFEEFSNSQLPITNSVITNYQLPITNRLAYLSLLRIARAF